MKCLLNQLCLAWDSEASFAHAEQHAATCPQCARRLAQRKKLAAALRLATPAAHDLREPLVANTLRAARLASKPAERRWMAPLFLGSAVTAVIAIGLIVPALRPKPAAPRPDSQLALAEISAGTRQIASALTSVPRSVRLDRMPSLAALGPQFATFGGGDAPPTARPATALPVYGFDAGFNSGLQSLREQVDPLGITDKSRWTTIRNLLNSASAQGSE